MKAKPTFTKRRKVLKGGKTDHTLNIPLKYAQSTKAANKTDCRRKNTRKPIYIRFEKKKETLIGFM